MAKPTIKKKPSKPVARKQDKPARKPAAAMSPKAAAKKSIKKKHIKELRPSPERVHGIIEGLRGLYPDVECELKHESPYQLIVATILSAQCTDERVNMVTPELFRRWPDPAALATAEPEELEKVIHSTGFFRNKAKNLLGMARNLIEKHGGEVPDTMVELLSLPGVARKTANVVLGTAFGIPSGVVVDTHVMRLSNLLGLTQHKDPVRIEHDLQQLIPQNEWIEFSHRLIWHGRRVCIANRPRCAECPLPCPSRLVAER